VIEVVEEPLDIQVNNPVLLPASLPGLPHCLSCRFPRTIPIGVGMQ
jgi:hypothetical protein